jgi:hypothetical protein
MSLGRPLPAVFLGVTLPLVLPSIFAGALVVFTKFLPGCHALTGHGKARRAEPARTSRLTLLPITFSHACRCGSGYWRCRSQDRRRSSLRDAGLARACGRHARGAGTPTHAGHPHTGQKRPLGDAQPPPLPVGPVASTRDNVIRWRLVGLDFLSLSFGKSSCGPAASARGVDPAGDFFRYTRGGTG